MKAHDTQRTVFYTAVGSPGQLRGARLLIDSLRAFGGPLARSPVWVFEVDPTVAACDKLATELTTVWPLAIPPALHGAWFAAKVSACARAEMMAAGKFHAAVWVAPDCLFVRPPLLLALDDDIDAAVRPVHHRNIGLLADALLDPFWRRVYAAVDVEDVSLTVETFVEHELVRAYFNTHAFALNPGLGLCAEWLVAFERLFVDRGFQSGACRDTSHRIFLHQAPLGPLIATRLSPERLRILPSTYSYPYNLHSEVPLSRRAGELSDLVSIAYEDRSLNPAQMSDIGVAQPLRSWLATRAR